MEKINISRTKSRSIALTSVWKASELPINLLTSVYFLLKKIIGRQVHVQVERKEIKN